MNTAYYLHYSEFKHSLGIIKDPERKTVIENSFYGLSPSPEDPCQTVKWLGCKFITYMEVFYLFELETTRSLKYNFFRSQVGSNITYS